MMQAADLADNIVSAVMLGAFGFSVVVTTVKRRRRDRSVTWDDALERPWRGHKQATTPFPTLAEQEIARGRARDVAALTLGMETYALLEEQGYIDLDSASRENVFYRLRPGRRIEVFDTVADAAAARSRWLKERERRYLCVYPVYPLPEQEFLAQLYMQLRDDEERILREGVLQYVDARIANVF